MIVSSRDLATRPKFYTLLVLGPKRIGKSTMCISTAPKGKTLVVVFEADDSLTGAEKRTKKNGFDVIRVSPPKSDSSSGAWNAMLSALREIRQAVEAGSYTTLVFDSISVFGGMLEREICSAPIYHTGGDVTKPLIIQSAYGDIARKSDHLFAQIAILSRWAHVIVTMHYTTSEKELDGQTSKYGEGFVPLWPGQFREKIGLHLTNIVWMDNRGPDDVAKGRVDKEAVEEPYNGRVFVTGDRGGWGPGCRMWAGNYVVPADIARLFARFDDENSEEEDPPSPKRITPPAKPAVKPAVRPMTPASKPVQQQQQRK